MTQPVSMPWSAPVFGKPPHRWQGVRMAAFPFTPREGAVERILPPGMERVDAPGLITLISYPQTEGIHPYNELVVFVPVRVEGVVGNYVPHIYVTTDEALIAGREIAGFPKKIARVEWNVEGDALRGSVSRWDKTLLTVEGTVQGPLPADGARPAAAGAPTFNYKLIPDPAGDIEIEEITSTPVSLTPREQRVGTARLRCGPSDLDPLADVIPDVEGPMVLMTCDVTIPPGAVVKRITRGELVA